MQIDAMTMTTSIIKECKSSILDELQSFRTLKTCKHTKCQVLSLIGKLSFVSKVVSAGRIFLRCPIDLQHLHYRLPITLEPCLVARFPSQLVWHFTHHRYPLDTKFQHAAPYWCSWNRRMGCLLEWLLVTGTLVTSTICHAYHMERTLCRSLCCSLLGAPLE